MKLNSFAYRLVSIENKLIKNKYEEKERIINEIDRISLRFIFYLVIKTSSSELSESRRGFRLFFNPKAGFSSSHIVIFISFKKIKKL